ncbi:hypothetical protein MMC11_006955 [Xylographa trunciseda]|nr:hypothetical protein [Xylographa trunciseda]
MDFPPDARVPIAQLQPSLDSTVGFVEGLVTLIWPYSSSNQSTSILLVEPDFRLRRHHGQVRISFTGASAKAIAKSGLTSGDRVSVRLTAALWLPEDAGGTTPGRGPGWELQYGQSLTLQISQEAREPFLVEVHSTSQTLALQDVVRTPPPSPLSRYPLPPHIAGVSQDAAKTWSSPAFLKRKSLAETPFLESVYDPFTDDGEDGDDRPRKKAKFSRPSDQWTFLERTPSPDVESEGEAVGAGSDPIQKHQQEEQVGLIGSSVPSVRTSGLSNPIDSVIATQNPRSLEIQAHVATPSLPPTDGHSEADHVPDEPSLAASGFSNESPSLEREKEEVVQLGEKNEYDNSNVSESASLENVNNEFKKQTVESDGLEEELSLQFEAYDVEKIEFSNEHNVLHRSDAQQHHLSLENSLETDGVMQASSPLNATPRPMPDPVPSGLDVAKISRLRSPENETRDDQRYVEDAGERAQGYVVVPSIASTSRTGERPDSEISNEILFDETDIRNANSHSEGWSPSEMRHASGILNTSEKASVSKDENDLLDTDHEDDRSFVMGEEEVDLSRQEAEEGENTITSMAEVCCEDSAGLGTAVFDKTGKITEVINIDSEDDEEDATSEEDEDSGDSIYERINVLEHAAELPDEGSEETYRSGHESIPSVNRAAEPVDQYDYRAEDSEDDFDSDENAELADLENDGQLNILEYPIVLPNNGSDGSEGSHHSGPDDLMSFVEAAVSIVEHEDTVEDNEEAFDSDEYEEVADQDDNGRISEMECPDEPSIERPDGSPHSDSTEPILLEEPAIPVDVAKSDEHPDIVEGENNSHLNILEYPAETSNREINQFTSLDIARARTFARAAKSIVEHTQTDKNDEEPEIDMDEKPADLGDEDSVSSREDSPVSFTARSQRADLSDANEAMSAAESGQSVAEQGRGHEPDSQSHSALAEDAVLHAELQEGITMDEALQLPLEQLSSPLEDHTVNQDLREDRGSSEIAHDPAISRDRFSFPFTPQLSGLSALYPDPGTSVDQRNMYNQPAEIAIVNPTSSFTLPDYDSVLGFSDSQPGEQLITPLPTQIPEPEEDDLKSQVELDFEDEGSNTPLQDMVEDDTELLPLPVSHAASRPLIGILKNLRRSSESRAKFGNEDISEGTKLWSDVTASKKSFEEEQQDLPSESHITESPVDFNGLTNVKSLEASSPQDVSNPNEIEGELSKHATDKTSLQTSQLGFRTQLSYFAPLSSLENHFNSTIDVFALAILSTKASRATKGPRDYCQTVFIVDSSSYVPNTIPKYTTAQIFRPYKQALPTLLTGDALLLRNFKVQVQKHNPMLLSTENSAWAVFREDTDVQIRGPHVEFGEEEEGIAKGLTEWWHSLGSEVEDQLVSSVSQVESSSKDKPKVKKKEKRVSEVVHELRDGTKYTDSSADMNSIHELRDGTMYADDEVI